MQALVLSTRLDTARRSLLARLLPGVDPAWVGPGDPLPDLAGVTAVVVDGPVAGRPDADLTALARLVHAGASMVAIGAAAPQGDAPAWTGLLGVCAGPASPPGEYVAALASDDVAGGLTARLPAELVVVDAPTGLVPNPGRPMPTVLARIGVDRRPVATVVDRGRGRVLVTGLGHDDRALASPELAALLRRALARPAPAAAAAPVGVAVLGFGAYGGMGSYHGRAVEATAGLAFVATCDGDATRRKAAEQEFPGVRAYADATELADDDDVAVVVVATPPVSHTELALAMLRAGKHVVCEKPMCITTAEADRLAAAAAAADRVLTVHQNRRWDTDFLAVQNAVAAGRLGEVFNVETFVGGFAHPCRAWHSDTAVSGGAVYDWGSHHVDWVLQLLGGLPAVVQTHGHKRVWHDVTNLDQLRVRMTWPDGREAEFLQSDVAGVRRPKFYVQGTEGTLVGWYRPVTVERIEPPMGYVAEVAHHAEAPADLLLARYESGSGLAETRLPLPAVAPFAFHRNLADHLLLGEALAVTPAAARRVVAVLEAAQRSSDGGSIAVAVAPDSGPADG